MRSVGREPPLPWHLSDKLAGGTLKRSGGQPGLRRVAAGRAGRALSSSLLAGRPIPRAQCGWIALAQPPSGPARQRRFPRPKGWSLFVARRALGGPYFIAPYYRPTNVFMIKGTASPSIVPDSPTWKP